MRKLVVLGLDGFNPELVKAWSDDLPSLMEFQDEGIWGKMESTVPPNSLPAWTCAQMGRNPGYLGIWGSTFRDNFSYTERKQVDVNIYGRPEEVNYRRDERDPLFRLLLKRGQKVAIINVPNSWPPPRVTGGYCISGSSIPTFDQGYTWPDSLRNEVEDLVGEYIVDASKPGTDYREMGLDEASERIREMDEQRFTLLKRFITNKQCDYIFAVITGTSKMAHLFYRYFDKSHKQYEETSSYSEVLKDYYKFIDKEVGKVRDTLDSETVLMIHSAHSIQRLDGRINLNEWLIDQGYMVLQEYPSKPLPLKNVKVDWSKTKAWSTGQMGQIYLNVKGRDTEGIVEEDKYDSMLDELSAKLEEIKDPSGNSMKVEVLKRAQLHTGPKSQYGPDLFVFFDEGRWNTDEMVGAKEIHSSEYRSGYDDTVNGLKGYFCVVGPNVREEGEKRGISVIDVAPTVLSIMGVEIPDYMEGKPFVALDISEEELEAFAVQERLSRLGY